MAPSEWSGLTVLMRFSVLGVLTMLASVLAACDSDDGGTLASAGTGGNAGAGGNAGMSGVAGTGGNAGSAGTPGSGGASGCGPAASSVTPLCSQPGNGGSADDVDAGRSDPDAGDAGASDASDDPGPPCTGCLELRASVAANDESAFFQILYDTAADMSAATVTFRLRVLSPEDQVRVAPFATDGSGSSFGAGEQIELGAADGFVDLALDVAAIISDVAFDPSDVRRVGIYVGYTGGIGAEASQDLVLLLDSVTFTGVDTPNLAFTTDSEGFDRADDVGVTSTQVVHR